MQERFSMIKNENFYVIHGWMLNELDISGAELQVYAILYGYSQDGESWFKGSATYLSEWTGRSKRSIYDILKKLTEKELIEKKEIERNGIKLCDYRVIRTSYPVKKLHRGDEETSLGGDEETSLGGSEETSHHNIDIHNIDNHKKEDKNVKHKYGEYKNVLLTDKEKNKLIKDFGEPFFELCVAYLDKYIEEKGYKSKSHNLTIRRWVIDAVKRQNLYGKKKPVNTGSLAGDALDDLDDLF